MGAVNSESLLGEYVLIYIHHHFIITVKTARTNLVCSMSLSCHGMLIQFHQREEAEGSGGCDGGDQVRGAPVEVRRGSVLSALKKSLERLGLPSVELYQLHWSVSQARSSASFLTSVSV